MSPPFGYLMLGLSDAGLNARHRPRLNAAAHRRAGIRADTPPHRAPMTRSTQESRAAIAARLTAA